MGMVASAYYTADMVRSLPEDGNRYEVVHGELLVTPAPRKIHQRIVRRLLTELSIYLEESPVGEPFASPADISWDDDTLVQPDIFVLDLEEAKTPDWKDAKTLLLVIEVLSPSTARQDRGTKRRLYQEQRIPAYWIVDTEREVIEVWTPDANGPKIVKDKVAWYPAGAEKAFEVDLKILFKPAG